MDTTLLFLGEIQRQCNFALIAYEEMKSSLNMMKPGDNKELDHFWYSVQSFLVAVANISNYAQDHLNKFSRYWQDISSSI